MSHRNQYKYALKGVHVLDLVSRVLTSLASRCVTRVLRWSMVSCMAFTLRRSVSLSLCSMAFSWYRSLKPSEPSSHATRFPCTDIKTISMNTTNILGGKDTCYDQKTWRVILDMWYCSPTKHKTIVWALQAAIVLFWMINTERILLLKARTQSHYLIQSVARRHHYLHQSNTPLLPDSSHIASLITTSRSARSPSL